jgi:sporulation protein YlmC with PRC-barrel domain
MQVKLGATVISSDGENVGAVDRLVIDPVSRQLLSLIVRQGR